VVLQTFLPDDPTIQAAIRQDFVGFARSELRTRRQVGLPPFARQVRIILRDQDQDALHTLGARLAEALAAAIAAHSAPVTMRGPMPCPIGRVAGYHRHQIVLIAPQPGPLQRVLADVREKGGLARSDRVAVDVDPVSLL
jgi:primosomal protein N' (replication factor Y)